MTSLLKPPDSCVRRSKADAKVLLVLALPILERAGPENQVHLLRPNQSEAFMSGAAMDRLDPVTLYQPDTAP